MTCWNKPKSRNGAWMEASERPIASAARAGFQTRTTVVSRRSPNNAVHGTPAQKQVDAASVCSNIPPHAEATEGRR